MQVRRHGGCGGGGRLVMVVTQQRVGRRRRLELVRPEPSQSQVGVPGVVSGYATLTVDRVRALCGGEGGGSVRSRGIQPEGEVRGRGILPRGRGTGSVRSRGILLGEVGGRSVRSRDIQSVGDGMGEVR